MLGTPDNRTLCTIGAVSSSRSRRGSSVWSRLSCWWARDLGLGVREDLLGRWPLSRRPATVDHRIMATADPASVGGQARSDRLAEIVARRYVVFPLLVVMLAVRTVGFLQYRRQVELVSSRTGRAARPTRMRSVLPAGVPGLHPPR